MEEQIREEIVAKMQTITEEGIDIAEIQSTAATIAWTHAVDENIYQFSTLAQKAKSISNKLTGEEGIFTRFYRWKYGRKMSI